MYRHLMLVLKNGKKVYLWFWLRCSMKWTVYFSTFFSVLQCKKVIPLDACLHEVFHQGVPTCCLAALPLQECMCLGSVPRPWWPTSSSWPLATTRPSSLPCASPTTRVSPVTRIPTSPKTSAWAETSTPSCLPGDSQRLGTNNKHSYKQDKQKAHTVVFKWLQEVASEWAVNGGGGGYQICYQCCWYWNVIMGFQTDVS